MIARRNGLFPRLARRQASSTTSWIAGRLLLPALIALGAISTPAQQAPVTATNAPLPRPEEMVAHARLSRWKPLFRGVDACQGSAEVPRRLQVQCVRVDLLEPGVSFLVTPRIGHGTNAWAGRTTSEFLREFRCQVALNGSVFSPFAKRRGDPIQVLGFSLSRGDCSPSNRDRDALLIGANRHAWIAHSPHDANGAYNGLSGYFTLLADGKNTGAMEDRHPRSAVGISRDGRYLFLVAIDGRQPSYSTGASTAEAAEWMRLLGAYNAVNLDGGGSTALVVEGTDGQPQVLNRPSGPPPGQERRVANHLGVFAQPLGSAR
jgi:hypothetical protein